MIKCDESKPYAFVSYSHKDSEKVYKIIETMRANGYNVWYDSGIDPGTEWDQNIASHVKGCSYFIAFVSQGYVGSENCKDELNYARDLNKERLLVYLEDVDLPDGMAMRMNRIQAIWWNKYESSNMDEAYMKLFSAQGIEKTKINEGNFNVNRMPEMVGTIVNTNGNNAMDRAMNTVNNTVNNAMNRDMGNAMGKPVNNAMSNPNNNVMVTTMNTTVRNMPVGNVNPAPVAGNMETKSKKTGKKALATVLALAGLALVAGVAVFLSQGSPKPDNNRSGGDKPAISQDVANKIEEYQQAAAAGDVEAMNNLGDFYYYGDEAGGRDYLQAITYYEQAAELGNAKAMYSMGYMYENGEGVSQNYQMAITYYEQAAAAGNTKAMNSLGQLYENGEEVSQDYQMAIAYYEQAISLGSAAAMNNMGMMYVNGYGVNQDLNKAKEYFEKAAELGNEAAKENLELHFSN